MASSSQLNIFSWDMKKSEENLRFMNYLPWNGFLVLIEKVQNVKPHISSQALTFKAGFSAHLRTRDVANSLVKEVVSHSLPTASKPAMVSLPGCPFASRSQPSSFKTKATETVLCFPNNPSSRGLLQIQSRENLC